MEQKGRTSLSHLLRTWTSTPPTSSGSRLEEPPAAPEDDDEEANVEDAEEEEEEEEEEGAAESVAGRLVVVELPMVPGEAKESNPEAEDEEGKFSPRFCLSCCRRSCSNSSKAEI